MTIRVTTAIGAADPGVEAATGLVARATSPASTMTNSLVSLLRTALGPGTSART